MQKVNIMTEAALWTQLLQYIACIPDSDGPCVAVINDVTCNTSAKLKNMIFTTHERRLVRNVFHKNTIYVLKVPDTYLRLPKARMLLLLLTGAVLKTMMQRLQICLLLPYTLLQRLLCLSMMLQGMLQQAL